MLNMIRQFTFHKPREILQPTLWLVSFPGVQYASGHFGLHGYLHPGPGVCAALYPEPVPARYPCGHGRWVLRAAVCGGADLLLLYLRKGIPRYGGQAHRLHTKLRRQPLGFFSNKESGELISSFSGDFANVEYTLCYWLPYPLGVGVLLVISIVWICVYDWHMGWLCSVCSLSARCSC